MSALALHVDPGSPVPPFEQLREQLARMVASGVLPAGTRLPPIRQLAGDLGLAPGTVARAVRELEATGLVVTRGRHGTHVADVAHPPPDRRAELDGAAGAFVARVRQLGAAPEEAIEAIERALRTT